MVVGIGGSSRASCLILWMDTHYVMSGAARPSEGRGRCENDEGDGMTTRLRFHLWLWSLVTMLIVITWHGFLLLQWPQLRAERARFAQYEKRIIHVEELIHRNAELETRELRRQRHERERQEAQPFTR